MEVRVLQWTTNCKKAHAGYLELSGGKRLFIGNGPCGVPLASDSIQHKYQEAIFLSHGCKVVRADFSTMHSIGQ